MTSPEHPTGPDAAAGNALAPATDPANGSSGAQSLQLAVLGASAGCVDALSRTLSRLPAKPAFAVVVLTHLDRAHDSRLVEVLAQKTALPVQPISGETPLEHGKIYVLTPDVQATLSGGRLQLHPRPQGRNLPIDVFLTSAAREDARVAAVILSGTGQDGVAGVLEIKAAGGLTIAQAPNTAKHDGMPRAVMEAHGADAVLDPEAIGPRLEQFFAAGAEDADPQARSRTVGEALTIIRERTGQDLQYYKEVNVSRRLLRRAFLQAQGDVGAYLQRLRGDDDEVAALRDDLLIGVTAFMRDPEFVHAVERQVLPELLARDSDTIRVWVPACSTGEEAYSIAMLAHCVLDEAGISRKVQVFGSDINAQAIAQARVGHYSAESVAGLPERLRRRYLEPDEGGWRVKKHIRELCVFATHDLFTNAPFSNVDLVSCRNLLIYLRKPAKRHAFEVFFYALRKSGHLLLGCSEAADAELFEEDAPHLNLYRRRQVSRPPVRGFSFSDLSPSAGTPARSEPSASALESVADRLALARYAPPGFIVDAFGHVVHFRGDTSALLRPSTGDATLSLARLVRPELQVDLRTALMEAVRNKLPVRRERVKLDGRPCVLEVVPLPVSGNERYFLVSVALGASTNEEPRGVDASSEGRAEDLERYVRVLGEELEHTRAQLKSVVTEYDATSEELRTANEEVLSANEELQSANEELQSAKRELEIANSELSALNAELQRRNGQLVELNDDLGNLIRGIPVPVLMLDRRQQLRHYSPAAAELFGLDDDCLGAPLRAPAFAPEVLESAVAEAINELRPVEREVRCLVGRWYALSARAYQTSQNRIEGAVLAFQDIDRLKIALQAANAARAEAERANAAKNDFLALVSHELRAPLNVVTNWIALLKLLRVDEGADPRVGEALETIDRNCRSQARLIDDLLDVSRITSGRLTLDLRPTDFSGVVRSIAEGMRPLATHKDISVTTSGTGGSLIVSGDMRRLQQIVANLTSNAIKFTPAGGHIEIALSSAEGCAELSVTDSGIGIDAAQLPRIFERFSAGDITKTREYGGMGLGLSIVRNLVEGHGGTVRAFSSGNGHGARFVVRLPLAPAPLEGVEMAGESQRPMAISLKGLRLLLVDDEVAGRNALAQLLGALGAEVVTAAGTAEALTLLAERAFDALISDIAMPGDDGYRLMQTLRAREKSGGSSRLFALALTGFAGLADRDDALAAGYDAHMGKPADVTAIAERILSGRARAAART